MTTLILMSDIHGNMPALRAVADALPPHDSVFVAGDLCLKGSAPDDVIDFIRERGWTVVMGDKDHIVAAPPAESKHGEQIAWTRERLGRERLAWLGSLPFSARYGDGTIEINAVAPGRTGTNTPGHEAATPAPNATASGTSKTLLVVHANPVDMKRHLWPSMGDDAVRPFLEQVDAEILAFGHCHIPYLRPVGGIVLADVASVGHPKDGNLRAAFTVVRWEGDQRSIEQVRVAYDVERTVRDLRESTMPGAGKQVEALLRASY